MVLHGKDRQFPMAQTFDRSIVKINFGDDSAALFQLYGRGRETVILRGDGHLAGFEVFHRLVRASMTEL